MPERSVKRSINFPPDMLKALDRLATRNHTTTSELVRQFVEKGQGIVEQQPHFSYCSKC